MIIFAATFYTIITVSLITPLQVSYLQEYIVFLSIFYPKSSHQRYIQNYDELDADVKKYLNFNHHANWVHGSMNDKAWPRLDLGTSGSVKLIDLDVLDNMQWKEVFELVANYRLKIKFVYNKNLPFVYLGGYGVELVLKSTEYSVSDDRHIENSFTLEHNKDDALDLPVSSKKIEDNEIKEKAFSYIYSLDEDDKSRFDALRVLSQNFIMYQEFISNQKVNKKLIKNIMYNSKRKDYHGMFLNGLNIHQDLTNAIGLDGLIRDEKIAMNYVSDKNAFFKSKSSSKITYQIAVPTWLNQIEGNSKFKSYPATLQEAFQMWQFYRQMMPVMPIQKHIINVVIISNLPNIKYVESILTADIAIHLGIVPIPYSDEDPGLSYALHFIAKKNIRKVRDFLREYIESDKPYIERIKSSCESVIKCDKLRSSYLQELPQLKKFADRLQLTSKTNLYWLNGEIYKLEEDFEQMIIQHSREQYAALFDLLETGQVDDSTNFFNFFNKGFASRHEILDNVNDYKQLSLLGGEDILGEIEYLSSISESKSIVILFCQIASIICKETQESLKAFHVNTENWTSESLNIQSIPLILAFAKTAGESAILINGRLYQFNNTLSRSVLDQLANREEIVVDCEDTKICHLNLFGINYSNSAIEKRNSLYYSSISRKTMTSKLKR
eukprot:NODE_5_length_72347_cov_1.339331.p8 type:complete len:667 gc:universal NODE_5_length_72347_cov_1.339331:67649-69649(+)